MDESAVATGPSLTLDAPSLRELDRRVQSLESAVARLGDADALEERVVARLHQQLPQVKAPPADTGVLEERILARLAERVPAAPFAPLAESAPPSSWLAASDAPRGGGWSAWLILDMFDEVKVLCRMLRDRRYRMAWSSRLVVLVLVPAIVLTHWWLPLAWVPGVGGFLVNGVNLALAFVVYRALGRETRRYRDLPPR